MLLCVSGFKMKTNLSWHDALSLPQRIHMVEHTRVGSKTRLLLHPLNMWSRCTLRLRQHMLIVLHSRRHRHHQQCWIVVVDLVLTTLVARSYLHRPLVLLSASPRRAHSPTKSCWGRLMDSLMLISLDKVVLVMFTEECCLMAKRLLWNNWNLEVARESVSSRLRLRLSAEYITNILCLWLAIAFLEARGCLSMSLSPTTHWNSTYMVSPLTPKAPKNIFFSLHYLWFYNPHVWFFYLVSHWDLVTMFD